MFQAPPGSAGSYFLFGESKARRAAEERRATQERDDARSDRRREGYWGILNIAEPYITGRELGTATIADKNDVTRALPSHLNSILLYGAQQTHEPATLMFKAVKEDDVVGYDEARGQFLEKAFEDVGPFR